ncbi:MAG: hypothetical protein UT46_C0004G0005 [Candidatus Levybacteria bacterium GW2011_GWA1_39_34]|nr:MAG: hypothetical protein UT46_C0004G0005 [Candidatus Levybacteria bacterium GW2011_GWA1_39_34]
MINRDILFKSEREKISRVRRAIIPHQIYSKDKEKIVALANASDSILFQATTVFPFTEKGKSNSFCYNSRMSIERGNGSGSLDDMEPTVIGENINLPVGEVVIQMRQEDALEVFADQDLIQNHPHLGKAVNTFHEAGQEVWGQFNAHKGGIVLTAVGIAGVVGIGILIRRRKTDKNPSHSS